LLIIGPNLLFHSPAQPTANSPKSIFHIIKMSHQASVVLSVVRALVPDGETISVFVCVCVGGCDGLPSLEISLESMELHADTTEHTAEPY
jgi:hypothetical protein